MRKIIFTTKFKRDVKLVEKRHKDTAKLLEVFRLLTAEDALPERSKIILWVEIGSTTVTCISSC